MIPALLAVLLAAPAKAGGLAELCRQAGADCPAPVALRGLPRPALPQASCPAGYDARRQGGCWLKTGVFGGQARAFLHARGVTIDPRCLKDERFTAAELLEAVETVWRKLDPAELGDRGCLGRLNPGWARELAGGFWSLRLQLSCPDYDPEASTCATHETRDGYDDGGRRLPDDYHLVTLENARRCLGAGTTGLAGILFHETLHAAGADSFSTEKHNAAWGLPQYEFVRDRVYGAEAVCFFGQRPDTYDRVNRLQCLEVVRFNADRPDPGLCSAYPARFTDMPAGLMKH